MTNLDTVLFGGAMPSGGILQSAHLPVRNNAKQMHVCFPTRKARWSQVVRTLAYHALQNCLVQSKPDQTW